MKTKFQIQEQIDLLAATLGQSINLHCPENIAECSNIEGRKSALEWALVDEEEINKHINEIEDKLELLKSMVKNVAPSTSEEFHPW